MENREMEELHGELLDVTRAVVEACEKNHIRYYMSYGSCLGAIRHQDIIPWDDDVDFIIDYRDYDKLKQAFQDSKDYFYQDLVTDPEHFTSWPKLRKNNTTSMDVNCQAMDIHWGICVDLFPILPYDKPEADKITKLKLLSLQILARFPYYKKLGSSFQHKIWTLLYRIMGQKGRTKLFFRILDSIVCPDGEYLLDLDGSENCLIMHRDVYGEGCQASLHGMPVKVPTKWDEYLRRLYGDNYMEIPPEGSPLRYSHSSSIIDCHKNYTEYKGTDKVSVG